MKVAAYTRFSSDMQKENSTDVQIRGIADFVQAGKHEFVGGEFHFKDEAESGRTLGRTNFLRMLQLIKSGRLKVDAIVVYKFSRFMRNLEESILCKRMLARMGVKVLSATEV